MIKKLICTIIAAVMLCSVWTFTCSALLVEVKTEVPVPPKIVFLGDSIAAGYGLEGYTNSDNYHCRSYSVILSDRYNTELQKVNVKFSGEMVNKAVSGDTSWQLLDHINSGELDDALKDSDVVVISIGGNDVLGVFIDFLYNDLGLKYGSNFREAFDNLDIKKALEGLANMSTKMDENLDGFGDRLDTIVAQINSKTDGDIFVQTLYNPVESTKSYDLLAEFAQKKIDSLNKIIKEHAVIEDKTNYQVIDVAANFEGKAKELTNISEYDIHPNAEGHKAIAELVDNSVREKGYTYVTYEEVPDPIEKSETKDKSPLVGIAVGIFIVGVGAAVLIISKNKSKGGNDQ